MKYLAVKKRVKIKEIHMFEKPDKQELDILKDALSGVKEWHPILLAKNSNKKSKKKYLCMDGHHRITLKKKDKKKTIVAFVVDSVVFDADELEYRLCDFDEHIICSDGKLYSNKRYKPPADCE